MKKVLRLLIPLVIVAAAIGIWRSQDHGATSDSTGLNLYGNVDLREVGLAVNGSGRIIEMPVREGAEVSKGQLLARLDSERQQALADRAGGEVEAAEAVLARMLAGSRPEDILRTDADLAAAKVQANDAARTARRLKSLSTRNLASRESADNAASAAAAAQQRVRAADQVSRLVRLGPRAEDIAGARAQLKQAQARLALARKELSDTALYAPSGGTIRNRILEPGDMASPQRPLYTLAITAPLWVRAYVSETDLGRVRQGMTAMVSSDSFPGKQYRGWIGYISPSAEFTPQTVQTEEMRTQLVYQLRVYVCNPQGELRLGMPASVHIRLDQAKAAPGDNDPCQGK